MNIYFIQNSDGYIKIGRTSTSMEDRMKSLQTADPHPLKVLLFIIDSKYSEKHLHLLFDKYRFSGEWFEPAQEILDFIDMCKSDGAHEFDERDWEYRGIKTIKEYKYTESNHVYTFREFTKDENLLIVNKYREMTIPEISKILDRSEAAIARQIHWLLFSYLPIEPMTAKNRLSFYDTYLGEVNS